MKTGLIKMNQKEITRLKILQELEIKKISQIEAAQALKISARQVRRLQQKYKSLGAAGIVSQKREKNSNRAWSEAHKTKIIKLLKENYADFGPTLACEKLVEIHELQCSNEKIRQIMIEECLWSPKRQKRQRVYQRRKRRSQRGELVQLDGSDHAWFEDRAERCTLLVAIDDATSQIMHLKFVKCESTESYMQFSKEYIEQHGILRSFYTDKHSCFRINRQDLQKGTAETQVHRAFKELGIELICANSPQAKGRVERANGILQDRLVKELRLKEINDIQSANEFVHEFRKKYNKKFGKIPESLIDAHCKLHSDINLDLIFAIKDERTVSKELTFQYECKLYQIQDEKCVHRLKGKKLKILRLLNGEVKVFLEERELKIKVFSDLPAPARVIDSKALEWANRSRKENIPGWKRYRSKV